MDKESILNFIDIPETQTIEVKEWGGDVTLRPLTLGEALNVYSMEDDNERALTAISKAAINGDGGSIMTVDELRDLPPSQVMVIKRLYQSIVEMMGDIEGDEKK